jgi:hypothetical protein
MDDMNLRTHRAAWQHCWLWRSSVLAIGLMLVALGSYAYRGFATRIRADDFCQAGATFIDGMLAVQRWSYINWNSRFSSNLLLAVTDWIAEPFVQVAPLLTVIVWVAVAVWLGLQIGGLLNIAARGWFSWTLGVLLVFATATADSLYEALYWRPGYLTYTVPLVLLTCYAGWLVARIRQGRRVGVGAMATSALAMLGIGGLSETQAVLQLAALTLLLGVCLRNWSRPFRRVLLPLTLTGLAGSVAALWLMMVAPAITERLVFEEGTGLAGSATALLARIGTVVLSEVLLRPVTPPLWWADIFALILAVVLPAALALLWPPAAGGSPRLRLWLLLIPFMGVLLIAASVAPVSYGYSIDQAPPFRLLIVPRMIMVVGLIAWGYLVGVLLRRLLSMHARAHRLAPGVLAVLVGGLALGSAGNATATILASMPTAHRLAAGWDAQDRLLRAHRGSDVPLTVPARPGMPDITNVRTKWSNGCIARYYGLASVATPPARSTTIVVSAPGAGLRAANEGGAVVVQGKQPLFRIAAVDAEAMPKALQVELKVTALRDIPQNYDFMFQFTVDDSVLRAWDWPMYSGITLFDAPSLPTRQWQHGTYYRHTTTLPVQPGRYYVILWLVEHDSGYIVPLRATSGEFGGIPLGWYVIPDADTAGQSSPAAEHRSPCCCTSGAIAACELR